MFRDIDIDMMKRDGKTIRAPRYPGRAAYRCLDDVNHGKVPACSEGVTCQVLRATSIIREMDCPHIRM